MRVVWRNCPHFGAQIFFLSGAAAALQKKSMVGFRFQLCVQKRRMFFLFGQHQGCAAGLQTGNHIGQYIGEGFNFPRLDTMMLTMPISWQGNVEQYAGRLHRDYEGKRDVIIYDYVDAHIRVLESMYYKRLCTYRRIGYEILAAPNEEKQTVNAIFDSESYLPVYEKDLMQARKSIYIASPGLNKNKVRRLIALVEEQQTAGVIVTVITQPAESYPQTRVEPTKALQTALTAAGIYVVPQPDLHTHFAVIDQEIVWYGSTNLLSRDKEDDGLMRIGSRDVALELLEEIGR